MVKEYLIGTIIYIFLPPLQSKIVDSLLALALILSLSKTYVTGSEMEYVLAA